MFVKAFLTKIYCNLLFKYVFLYLFNNLDDDIMIAANYSEFRTNLKSFLDRVEFDNEVLIIKRGSGKGTVMMSLTEYNSVMETLYLLGNKANADWLRESIQQMNTGSFMRKDLIED